MFKNILVSTDGSRLAAKGVKAGVKLAASVGARVTAVYVTPPWRTPMISEGVVYGPINSPQNYKRAMERMAKKALAAVEIEAQATPAACARDRGGALAGHPAGRAREEVRRDLHGLARPRRAERAAAGQRDGARARALEAAGAGHALARR